VIVYLWFTARLRGGEISAEPGRAEGRRGAGDKLPVEPLGQPCAMPLTEQGHVVLAEMLSHQKKEPRVSGAQV
jgi:hypothetical protein